MKKINSRRVKRVFNKIPKSLKYLTLLIISILFILEFVIFPPLSAQIEHSSFTYQTEFENLFDSMSKQYKTTNEFQEYPFTAIKEIRHNPDRYIDKKVTITGHLQIPFMAKTMTPCLVDNDYIIYLDKRLNLEPKLNVKGMHVHPEPGLLVHGDTITIKGKIIYDETESVLIEPHEILYDGLTWSIKQP